MNALLVASVIGFFFLAILSAITILVFASAAVMHWFPNSELTKQLNDIWFDPVEQPDDIYGSAKAGDCLSPKEQK
jgi:hypothetical protein